MDNREKAESEGDGKSELVQKLPASEDDKVAHTL